MNPPILTTSNNSLKPFKANNHVDADNTKDIGNRFARNQKEIKKNLLEK